MARVLNSANEQTESHQRREETLQKRNPVLVYVEKLAATDENAWKDFLEPMGTGADIPKLFRHASKVSTCMLKDC